MSCPAHHVLDFQHQDVESTSPAELLAELIPLHASVTEELAAHLRHEFAVDVAEEMQCRYLMHDSHPEIASAIQARAGRTLLDDELLALAGPRDDVPWEGRWDWPTPLVVVGPAEHLSGNLQRIDSSTPESLVASLQAVGLFACDRD